MIVPEAKNFAKGKGATTDNLQPIRGIFMSNEVVKLRDWFEVAYLFSNKVSVLGFYPEGKTIYFIFPNNEMVQGLLKDFRKDLKMQTFTQAFRLVKKMIYQPQNYKNDGGMNYEKNKKSECPQ